MEKLAILTADMLDILFEGRNKSYGAYDLRRTYHKRITYALVGTVFICLLFVGGTILANAKKTNHANELATTVVLENFKKEEPKVEPPPPLLKPEPPKVEMTRFTPPKIVQDDQVKPDDEIKEVEKLEDTKISTINVEGVKDDGVVAPPVEKSTGVAEAPKMQKDIDSIFTVVQIPAQFEGGAEGWRKYLERNLNSDIPNQNSAPPAAYTVTVSFIVDRNGAISDVKAENDPGYGTKEEAIRAIKKGPNWRAAIQNGNKVIYRHKQNITFKVEE